MAERIGRCVNYGNCDRAGARDLITVPGGMDFRCPACHQELRAIGAAGGPMGAGKLGGMLAVVGGIVLVGMGVAAWFAFHPASSAPGATTPGVADVAAPGATQVILRLHGSNTIGAELAPALAETWLRKRGAQSVSVRRGMVTATLPGQTQPVGIEIQAKGSGTGFVDLGAGAADIAMSSRRVKPEEKEKLAGLGDLEGFGAENVIGLDGVAVIVHRSSKVRNLTREQVRQIFSGEVTDWKAAGGEAGEIHVYSRPPGTSGTFEAFDNLVLAPKKLTASAKLIEESEALSDAVSQDTGGIGFIGLPYVRSALAVGIAEAGTRPLLPNTFTVGREDYLLSRRLYLYLPPKKATRDAQDFVDFAVSDAGQAVVERIGFVAQTVKVESAKAAPDGANPLNLSFRFKTGAAELDNKALQDLKRVVDYVKTAGGGQGLMLTGYADNVGSAAANVALSKKRAEVVAGELRSRGLNVVGSAGLGAENPVASNDTPEGREQNRRVEIWAKK